MSLLTKLCKHPIINPSTMTNRTKNIWSFVGCVSITAITLDYIITDNEKNNLKHHIPVLKN